MKQDEGDGAMFRTAIGDILRCRNVSELSKVACVSHASLYKALNISSAPTELLFCYIPFRDPYGFAP